MTNSTLFAPLMMHDASPASRELLEQAQRYFGFVPNLLACMAHSPSALRAYLNISICFQYGTLTPAGSNRGATDRESGKQMRLLFCIAQRLGPILRRRARRSNSGH